MKKLTKLTNEIKKQLTAKAKAFEKGRASLKAYVVGDRENTFGLIGEWVAPPTYKDDGTIDADAICSGIQPDSILEYMGEAKDESGQAILPAAISTVRNMITASKPQGFKNMNQGGQPSPAREEAAEQIAKEMAKIGADGIDLIDATATVQILIEPFAKVAFGKHAKDPNTTDGKLPADKVLAFSAATLQAALRLVQAESKKSREASKTAKLAKADAEAFATKKARSGKVTA